MEKKKIFDDLQSRINQIIDSSPVKDIEKNVRAMITQALSRLDVVTREEFDLQAMTISQLREQIIILQTRLAALEKKVPPSDDRTV
ncbi:accessory factor UbiK family protein [Oxalobacter sp. OttesenSCG-928-P03]|nr:accessory factor UbiK family protein [Oxalobacter sp. OttesenSCG-928-P03]